MKLQLSKRNRQHSEDTDHTKYMQTVYPKGIHIQNTYVTQKGKEEGELVGRGRGRSAGVQRVYLYTGEVEYHGKPFP